MKTSTDLRNFEFNLKTKLKFGPEEFLNLPIYLRELSFGKIGVIVDSAISNSDYVKEILGKIKNDFLFVKIWDYDLKAEPDYDSLDRIKLLFLDGSKPLVDCFVGIGGGSVIDFAKGLATLVVNPGESRIYRGFPTNINPSLPTIAIPTTAGTGSEVTFNAAFIDLKEKKKLGINTRYNFPVLAILDPLLTLSCPNSVTASSGIDALVHIMEGYISLKTDPLTRTFAKDGFDLVFNNLNKILKDPENLVLRGNLQLGAYLGGIVLLGSGGGCTGALSYPLGVNFKVPHGIAGGFFLPHIIKHNVNLGYDYSQLYDLIEEADKSLAKEEKNRILVERLFDLNKNLGIPQKMVDFGVNEDNVEILLKETEGLVKAFLQNPVPFSVEEGKKLLNKLVK
jgi:alcohol dehydrogenase